MGNDRSNKHYTGNDIEVKYQVEEVCKNKFHPALPYQAPVSIADVYEPEKTYFAKLQFGFGHLKRILPQSTDDQMYAFTALKVTKTAHAGSLPS